MNEFFKKYLKLSDRLRIDYSNSLGTSTKSSLKELEKYSSRIPDPISIIYSNVAGTRYEINQQELMDFIPGYMLIHIDEFDEAFKSLNNVLPKNSVGLYFPLLRNYSSDFICVSISDGKFYDILHDENILNLIHENTEDFFNTHITCYEQNAYFLDEDGYLDYDIDEQFSIAHMINPQINYWKE